MRGGREGRTRSGEAPLRHAAAGLALAALACGAAAGGAEGQQPGEIPPPALVATGGLFHRLDFHGDGPSTLVGLRVRLPLGDHVVVEPGLAYTTFHRDTVRADATTGAEPKLLLLDFQVQAQLPVDVPALGQVRPWVGVGAGGAVDFREERGLEDFVTSTFTAGVGVALDVGARLTLLGEGRYRTLDQLEHRVVEGVLGLGWRL